MTQNGGRQFRLENWTDYSTYGNKLEYNTGQNWDVLQKKRNEIMLRVVPIKNANPKTKRKVKVPNTTS